MNSQFTLYSIGIAAENKPRDTRYLNVAPTEITPALDGEINFNPQEKTFSGLDADGQPYETKITEDITITAEWLPMGSNRVTPPDIRRGEPIALYRLADSDQFYWRCMGLRDDLRRLETVIYAFNASPNLDGDGIDISECYFVEISTHNKMITVGTSKVNGEPFTYNLQINTGEGQVTLEDDIGNHLFLDSGQVLWELQNAAGTIYRLDQEDIYGYAPRNIDMEAVNNIKFEAGKKLSLIAGNEIYQTAPTHKTESETVTVDADTVTTTASSVTMDAPTTTATGNLSVGGSMSVAGGISMGSGGGGSSKMEVEGNMELKGDVDVTGTMTCDRLVAKSGVSAPNV